MTKRQVLTRYVLLAVLAAVVVAVTDLTLVALGFGWLAWMLDVAFAVALVLLTWGAFAANSPLFGRVVNGATVTEPVVAITFDDGPSPDTTPKVLDALRTDGARATFFVLGKHAERYPEVVERIVREGHEVASHGYDHSILTFASRREITRQLQRTDAVLRRIGTPPVRLFRTPHGFRNPLVNPTARRLGLRVCGWTAGVFDTARPGVETIVDRSKRALAPGAVLLLHDADGSGNADRSQTAAAVPAILDSVRHSGLRTVTMSELQRLAPERAISWRRIALVVLAVAVIVTVGLERLDRRQVEETWGTFRSLSVPLVIAALLANLVSVFFKAAVWKASLDTIPQRIRFRYRQIVPAIFVGFLLNTVLIARIGEVGRMVVLKRRLRAGGPRRADAHHRRHRADGAARARRDARALPRVHGHHHRRAARHRGQRRGHLRLRRRRARARRRLPGGRRPHAGAPRGGRPAPPAPPGPRPDRHLAARGPAQRRLVLRQPRARARPS